MDTDATFVGRWSSTKKVYSWIYNFLKLFFQWETMVMFPDPISTCGDHWPLYRVGGAPCKKGCFERGALCFSLSGTQTYKPCFFLWQVLFPARLLPQNVHCQVFLVETGLSRRNTETLGYSAFWKRVTTTKSIPVLNQVDRDFAGGDTSFAIRCLQIARNTMNPFKDIAWFRILTVRKGFFWFCKHLDCDNASDSSFIVH